MGVTQIVKIHFNFGLFCYLGDKETFKFIYFCMFMFMCSVYVWKRGTGSSGLHLS